MSDDHVYRVIEITGSSPTSISDAIQIAVSRASKTLRNLRWFEVVQTRGHLDGGKISALPGHAEDRLHDRRLNAG